jgi:hypothetical protein
MSGLISDITQTQSTFKTTDEYELLDVSGTPTSKKILGSTIKTGVDPNPMTVLGDIIKGGASGAWAKLAIGLANQQLFVNAAGTDVEWGYGSKVVAYTRDMTAASGDVSYTGATFKPRSIIVLAVYTASLSIGFGDISNSNWFITLYGTNLATTYFDVFLTILMEDAAATKQQQLVLKSINTDGFTGTWTKVGTPAVGTGNFIVLYLR